MTGCDALQQDIHLLKPFMEQNQSTLGQNQKNLWMKCSMRG